MSEPEIGFVIRGRLYPWIAFDNWKHKEIRIVKAVTGYNPRELLLGQASGAEINLAFAAIAFWRLHPEVDEYELAKFMDELTPADIEFKGGELAEGDASPPDESGSESSESTEQSSESTPEDSTPKTSGSRRSPTASTSGRQPASES